MSNPELSWFTEPELRGYAGVIVSATIEQDLDGVDLREMFVDLGIPRWAAGMFVEEIEDGRG